MKKLLYLLFLVSSQCLAQQDFVILNNNDTLFGKVRRGHLNRNRVKLKNESGKQRIHFKNVKEWKRGEMPVVVIPISRKKKSTYMELLLVSNGRVKLYRDIFHLWTNNYFVFQEQKYVPLVQENLNQVLLNDLFTCNHLSEHYTQEKINFFNIEKVVNHYNMHCY